MNTLVASQNFSDWSPKDRFCFLETQQRPYIIVAQQTCNNNFRAHIRLPRTLQQRVQSFPLGIYAGNYNELVDNYTFVPSTYRSKWIGRFVSQVVEFLEALSVMKLSRFNAIKLVNNIAQRL